MKGYKVFNSDFTCKDFQHEVGEIGDESKYQYCVQYE